MVPWVCLQFVIVVFPDHTHLLFLQDFSFHILNFISYCSYYLIVACLPDKRCLSHRMYLYQVIMTLHFLNEVVNDIESSRDLIIMS